MANENNKERIERAKSFLTDDRYRAKAVGDMPDPNERPAGDIKSPDGSKTLVAGEPPYAPNSVVDTEELEKKRKNVAESDKRKEQQVHDPWTGEAIDSATYVQKVKDYYDRYGSLPKGHPFTDAIHTSIAVDEYHAQREKDRKARKDKALNKFLKGE